MANKTANLAIVNGKANDSSKPLSIQHFDISSALQTTLDIVEQLNIFSNRIQGLLHHSGYSYVNEELELDFKNGITTRNSLTYNIQIENRDLGRIKFMRRNKFVEEDIKLLETLLCCLVYPLNNAIQFQMALKMAYTDPLTQTRNRTAFNDSLNREYSLARRNNKPLSLVFLDIDNFKSINDKFGHRCGDMALVCVASWVNESIRNSDMVFRFGGEEFVILLSETDLNGAKLLAERIREEIEKNYFTHEQKLHKLTASFGVSTLLSDDSVESLISRSDAAMYMAKKNGKNCVMVK